MSPFKVFLAHNSKDVSMVKSVYQTLEENGFECWVAEFNTELGKNVSDKVKEEIEVADAVVVLWTKRGGRSEFVNQEIGYALRAGKTILPLVMGKAKLKGLIREMDVIRFSKNNIEEILESLTTRVGELADEKNVRNAFLWLGLIILLALLGFWDGEENG
jgi:hypothetical protein